MTAEPAAARPGAPAQARLAASIAGLRGWRRLGVAALLGALATAALPPLYLFPLLIPAFTGLLWLLDGANRPGRAALVGWAFGFGHFLTGLYWVGIAFLVDAERFGAVMPFAVAGLAAGFALYPALVCLATARIGWRGPARVALFATLWLAAEWLRSWLFTGFPWNLIGTTWSAFPAVLQLAALGGVWAVSLMTVLAAAAPAMLTPPVGGRARPLLAGVLLALPAAAWLAGRLVLAGAPAPGAAVVEGVRLRLVQPAIPQSLKWEEALLERHVAKQMALSLEPGFEGISHVIWPETAVPFLLAARPELQARLARIVPPGGALITGAPRGAVIDGERRIWNSLHALDSRGRIVATYDKHHLVPFGEYAPFRGLLELAKLTVGSLDFSAGPGPRTLSAPGLSPFSPLICYEGIFPGAVVAPDGGARWLLNVTNDAWFGTSSGPYQHFAAVRIRAVEEGLPLVRVANNGITAVVDPYGRVVARLGLDRVGVLDARLPEARDATPLYARNRDESLVVLLILSIIFSLILRRFVP
ncbi:MAG TPA: apolipoprotein N-acyltransferase [Kiloniellales bacterium]|nr:apolipoprotein N-acyltransferase [Kiloniellales bacterium]